MEKNNNDCINCKKCFKVCPMMKEFGDSPKELMIDILQNKSINKNMPYSCMLCGICEVECPKDIDLKEMFFDVRKDIFHDNQKELNDIGYKTIKFHQTNSFSSLFSKQFIKKNTKKIFFPGCSLSSYSSDLVLETYKYLENHIENISLVFECCGKPTLAMGDTNKFDEYYSKIEKMFRKNDIDEVIVACPNCFNTIRNNSDIKVISIWDVIKEYGLPENIKNHYDDLNQKFLLHDPCPIRNEHNTHESVREILGFMGIKIIEFEKNRKNTECCGSGGMVRVTNNEVAINQTKNRVNNEKTDYVISYCQSCCESMLMADKKVLHVLDFIFDIDVINKSKLTQKKTSSIKKWGTRYKGITLAKKMNIET
ncbi:(Fe-S)-binding protein [Clostridioides difficile]